MGGSPINSKDMSTYYSTRSFIDTAVSAKQVFKETSMPKEFNPAQMKLPREARDSALSPHSRGIIYAEDITGSMDRFLLSLIKDDFPRLITQTYECVSYNPHIMFMGVGDVAADDDAPLQVTQFETDLRMLDQLQRIYIEKGGGRNNFESYILPWYFAGKHIEMDCFEKRHEKGFLFTFGDEMPTPYLKKEEIEIVFGGKDTINERLITAEDCLLLASEKFICYHIILHGYYYNNYSDEVIANWKKLMGSHVCDLKDHSCLPELVTTILKMYEGKSKKEALDDITDGYKHDVVQSALKFHEDVVTEEKVKEDVNVNSVELF